MGKLFNTHEYEAHRNLIRVSEKNTNGNMIKKIKKHDMKSLMGDESYRYQINDISRLELVSSIRSKVGWGRNKVIRYKMN